MFHIYLLINSDASAGHFYLLPKIHKKGCRGRSVMKISTFVDCQLKPLVLQIPSYVKGEGHSRNSVFFEIANKKITLS